MVALPMILNPVPAEREADLAGAGGSRIALGPVGAPTTPTPFGSTGGAGVNGFTGEAECPFSTGTVPRPRDENLPCPREPYCADGPSGADGGGMGPWRSSLYAAGIGLP